MAIRKQIDRKYAAGAFVHKADPAPLHLSIIALSAHHPNNTAMFRLVVLSANQALPLMTHDLREAIFLANRICVMIARAGRIISDEVVNIPQLGNIGMIYSATFFEMTHNLLELIAPVPK
jgi:hypothetical protein